MLHNPLSITLSGLTPVQQSACQDALRVFLSRHGLESWGLDVTLVDSGLQTAELHVFSVTSTELGLVTRATDVNVDSGVDLGAVVDLCLETHYNACMNTKARGAAASARQTVLG